MKGFYIYESKTRKETVDCLELGNTLVSKGTKSKCSKDDTYDFETGALIALMKMCGVDKVVRACNEAFSEDTFKTYATKYERELNELKKDFDKVKDLKDFYKKNYEDVKEHYDKLGDRNKYLIDDINKKLEYIKEKDEEIKKLKSDKDKSWKNYQRNIQKKQDRINELNNIEEKYIELREEYDKLFEEKEKLQHEYNLCLNSENALKYSVEFLNKSIDKLSHAIDGYKNDLYKVAKRCRELEAKEAILNKQEETINKKEKEMSVYFGGRGNGKQYKALVALFKKIDKKKVQEAYKEAYGDRVIWCTSQPEVHPLSTAVMESAIYLGKRAQYVSIDEWGTPKKLTKREEMWEKIFKLHKENDVVIKVKREDVNTFLHELENRIPEITWASGVKIFETKYTIGDIYGALKTCDSDTIYFRLSKETKLSYSSDPDVYQYKDLHHIDYLPPMRWDLFKKGRLAVKVTYDNYKEFYEACERELGKKPYSMYCGDFTVSICKKDGNFEIFTIEDQKSTGRKIVDWEDVRENKTTMEDPYDSWSL